MPNAHPQAKQHIPQPQSTTGTDTTKDLVIDLIDNASVSQQRFDWLEGLFNAITQLNKSELPTRETVGRLSQLGRYLAMDFANMADVDREGYENAIRVLNKGGAL